MIFGVLAVPSVFSSSFFRPMPCPLASQGTLIPLQVFAGLATLLTLFLPRPDLGRWDSFLMDALALSFRWPLLFFSLLFLSLFLSFFLLMFSSSLAEFITYRSDFSEGELPLCVDAVFPVLSTTLTISVVLARVLGSCMSATRRSSTITKGAGKAKKSR